MNNQKSKPLTGAHNQRIDKTVLSAKESTAAWTGADHHTPKSNVVIPSSSAVHNAKEWVDDGSKL